MTNEHTSLENISLTLSKSLERVVCERWVGDWTDYNIVTPSSSDYCSTSFLILLGCSTGGPEGLCWELVLTVSNCKSNFNCLTPTNSNSLWYWVIKLFVVHLLPVGVTIAPNSTRPRSRLYLDIFDRVHLLFTQVHLLIDNSDEDQYVTMVEMP